MAERSATTIMPRLAKVFRLALESPKDPRSSRSSPPIGYNAGMVRFSLKWLFGCITLIAFGCLIVFGPPDSYSGWSQEWTVWMLGGPIIGAGIGLLSRRI